jgi:hypothetical protein
VIGCLSAFTRTTSASNIQLLRRYWCHVTSTFHVKLAKEPLVSAIISCIPGVASRLFTYSIRYVETLLLVVPTTCCRLEQRTLSTFPVQHAMPPQSLAFILQARQEVDSALKRLKLDNVSERKRKKVDERNHTASSFSASSKKVALIRAPNAAQAAACIVYIYICVMYHIYIYICRMNSTQDIYMCYVSDVFCLSAYFYRCG